MLPVPSMRPPQSQVITKVSISALVISLPILYVSLLGLPPSTLARDTTFWFLMTNSIIVIIAADSGMLFFSSNSTAFGGGGGSDDDDDPSSYLPGDTPPVAVEEDSRDAHSPVVPLMAPFGEPTAVNISDVVRGDERLQNDGVTSCKTTNTDMEGHPLALIKVEEKDDDATGKPGTDVNHALVVRAKEEEVAIEATTNKNYAVFVKGEEEEEEKEEEEASEPNKLLVEDGDDVADELAKINYDYAFTETEPWRPKLVTSKSLVDEEEEDQCPISDPRITPDDDVLQDKNVVVSREGKLRRWEAEGSRPAEEREYWQLSDEELNRRVEEFITRFNQEMSLQNEQEAGV